MYRFAFSANHLLLTLGSSGGGNTHPRLFLPFPPIGGSGGGIGGPIPGGKGSTSTESIGKFGSYQVIGRDDMQAMLEHIADRQLLVCARLNLQMS